MQNEMRSRGEQQAIQTYSLPNLKHEYEVPDDEENLYTRNTHFETKGMLKHGTFWERDEMRGKCTGASRNCDATKHSECGRKGNQFRVYLTTSSW